MSRVTLIFWLMLVLPAAGQDRIKLGTIQGLVIDRETQTPLIGANIIVKSTALGGISDTAGRFSIPQVPVGTYVLECRYLGYESQVVTDVIVRPQRRTELTLALQVAALAGGAVTVQAGSFPAEEEHPLSLASFSFEEIRRAPGAGGDISRILQSLPSLAKVNDQSNGLIVRGGSPLENAFYIDHIPVPNINHFPVQGASSGPIGMVQVDFIEEARFHAGGFSAEFGDRLSSVLDISFREGNRQEMDAQLDLSFIGFGGAMEGPLAKGKGSWLFAARRSYLDLVVKSFDVGTSATPSWGDYQGKIVWDLSPNHRLSGLFLLADDHNDPDHQAAVDNKMTYYGKQDLYQGTAGLSWRALWGKCGYSRTVLSGARSRYKENMFNTNNGQPLFRNRSDELDFTFDHSTYLRLKGHHSLEFGVQAHRLDSRYDNQYAAALDLLGTASPSLTVANDLAGHKIGAFANMVIVPGPRWRASLGLRSDYFTINRKRCWSPRAALSWQIDALTSISASAGLYRQSLPMLLLAQTPGNRALQDPRAVHYVVGLERLLTATTRATLEVYHKEYDGFPLDPGQPGLFVVDELYYGNGFFTAHQRLTGTGQARSRGVEAMIQKKLAQNIYGLASATFFRTHYRDATGLWRDRVFDNRFIFAVEGGYKPAHALEVSARWIYAGGAPYTPVDTAASAAAGETVLDAGRFNGARYPAYHSLNLRIDRRFTFSRSNLVAYLSVWNAYNRKNVAAYFWNEARRKTDVIYQYTALPIIGLEYEF
ncbi:MAG TPA: TonB-dependent receptor [bacterium]|nr:TonB-dependent receptor [bacterium]HPR87718.1 TonB-dependent receptor [bacterium]